MKTQSKFPKFYEKLQLINLTSSENLKQKKEDEIQYKAKIKTLNYIF